MEVWTVLSVPSLFQVVVDITTDHEICVLPHGVVVG